MLGKTHAVTTTATGLLGIYGLRHLTETMTDEVWYSGITNSFIELVGFDFDRTGFSLFIGLIICTLGLLLGSLLPDIDSKRSILGRYVPFVQDIIGHRTYTHTVWIIALISIGAYFAGSTFIWMIVIGYLSHVLQDSFSVQGISWFYPFGKGYKSFSGGGSVKNGFHLGLYRVGGVIETIIFSLMIALLFWMIYKWFMIAFM